MAITCSISHFISHSFTIHFTSQHLNVISRQSGRTIKSDSVSQFASQQQHSTQPIYPCHLPYCSGVCSTSQPLHSRAVCWCRWQSPVHAASVCPTAALVLRITLQTGWQNLFIIWRRTNLFQFRQSNGTLRRYFCV